MTIHKGDRTKKLSYNTSISLTGRCEEKMNFLQLNLSVSLSVVASLIFLLEQSGE